MTVLELLAGPLTLAGVVVGYLLDRRWRPRVDVLLTAPIGTRMPTDIAVTNESWTVRAHVAGADRDDQV